jgi:nicotinate-nucleotide adenylyltransferase
MGGRLRLGVMGGTFDPIHHGHLVAASEVQSVFGLDEVVFVPTGQPWQKEDRAVSPAEHRYLMTVIATASNPRFTVSRVDVERPGLTYTIDTLRDLKAQRGDVEMFFITGADALAQILSWKDIDELWSLAHFIGVTRPGHTLSDTGLPEDGGSLLEVPAMAISSTDCRQRVREGEPVWYLVPDGVVQYIGKYGLYREHG